MNKGFNQINEPEKNNFNEYTQDDFISGEFSNFWAAADSDKTGADFKQNLNQETEQQKNCQEDRGDSSEPEKISFEAALNKLEHIVNELQRNDLPLDKSMELFREGTKLVEYCKKNLDEAQQEVKELLDDGSQIDLELPNAKTNTSNNGPLY